MTSNLYAQVNFTSGEILTDDSNFSSNITALASADLNNDGFKEIIVGSYYDNAIMFYKNINGDLQYYQREFLIQNPNTNYSSDFSISCADFDNDGLIDIVVTHDFLDKVTWHKNLGNFNFGNENIITNAIDKPVSVVTGDVDNDGDIDIFVGSDNDENVHLFKNNGSGTFTVPLLLSQFNYAVSDIKLVDLDRNGFLDVVMGLEDGSIYWKENTNGTHFPTDLFITGSSGDGYTFDFLDINNDTYPDIVFSTNNGNDIKYRLNDESGSFNSETTIDNNAEDPWLIVTEDFDKDGLKDIIVTSFYPDRVGWYKNNNGSFSDFTLISDNVNKSRYLLVEDLENNNSNELIASSYENNQADGQKLSIFKKDASSTNGFKENIVNFYLSAVNSVRIADLNNDNENDIVSAYSSAIIWNKNRGNNVFSSHYLITEGIGEYTRDIEVSDLNDDGWKDIIATNTTGVLIYQNVDGNRFNLVYSEPVDGGSFNVEISDINKDGKLDLLVSHEGGQTPISKIINNGNFDFQPVTSVYTNSGTGYKAYNFKCGDLNGDGDIDIIVGGRNNAQIHWLENDGTGSFTYHLITDSFPSHYVDIGDIDNDGDMDIVSSVSDSYNATEISWFRNDNESGLTGPLLVDQQNCKSMMLTDLNNDGRLDIVGAAYEFYTPYDDVLFYYTFEESSFSQQGIIESLGDALSLDRDIFFGDLNNDNKVDIVTGYYFINRIKYFLNDSTLSTEIFDIDSKNQLTVFPNPSSGEIRWNQELNITRFSVYNSVGKLVHQSKNITENKLDLEFLSTGLYFIIGHSNNLKYTSKLLID